MVPKMIDIALKHQPTHKRALAYIRISSQRQVNGESPETQASYIKEYASRNDIEIVDTFYDEAKSGKNTDRAELQNMINYAQKRKGEIDYVIVYKMNRASRDIASYVTGFLLPLRNLGISVRSATEPIDESVFGQFMEGLSILVGQMDNQNKQSFTVDNMTSLALQGYWQHPPIVGYVTHKVANDLGKLRPTLKPNKYGSICERCTRALFTR
ncbi:MAG: site-specific recombinase [Patescibacteria group bacterium]|nr:site-specific recombinase [Patescibacteria group bacterium]